VRGAPAIEADFARDPLEKARHAAARTGLGVELAHE
jgi:hypothetical protein